MCIACRTSAPKSRLLRFVRAPDGGVVFDVKGRLDARGAYTCPTPSCVRRAVEREAFRRAFDEPVLADAAALERAVAEVLEAEILRGLGLGRRASQLVPGRSETFERVDSGELIAVVVARDLADRSQREVAAAAAGFPVWVGPSKEAIGRALGRGPTGVVGLLSGQVARRLVLNLERLGRFLGLEVPEDATARQVDASPSDDGGGAPCGTGVGSV